MTDSERSEKICEQAGCRIMKVGRMWVIHSIDGLPEGPGRGVYDDPEDAIRAALTHRRAAIDAAMREEPR